MAHTKAGYQNRREIAADRRQSKTEAEKAAKDAVAERKAVRVEGDRPYVLLDIDDFLNLTKE